MSLSPEAKEEFERQSFLASLASKRPIINIPQPTFLQSLGGFAEQISPETITAQIDRQINKLQASRKQQSDNIERDLQKRRNEQRIDGLTESQISSNISAFLSQNRIKSGLADIDFQIKELQEQKLPFIFEAKLRQPLIIPQKPNSISPLIIQAPEPIQQPLTLEQPTLSITPPGFNFPDIDPKLIAAIVAAVIVVGVIL